MGKSIKEFVGIDSLYQKPDGTKMNHEEVFSIVVNAIGLQKCIQFIPATKKQIQNALAKGDIHLNTIPLQKWDAAHPHLFDYSGITRVSLSDTVCTLKQAAKIWAKS